MKNRLSAILSNNRGAKGSFKGTLYPDNSLSIGYVPKKSISQSEAEYKRLYESQYHVYEEPVNDYRGYRKETRRVFEPGVALASISESSKLSQKRGGYGGKGITAYGQRVLRNGAILLERRYSRRRLGFFTATIPYVDRTALRIIRASWGRITSRFFQEISREYDRKKTEFAYYGCTEIQEKRYRATGDCVPHLHWVAPCYVSHSYEFVTDANWLRRVWNNILYTTVARGMEGRVPSIPKDGASIDAQIVKKSAGGYIGKYMSKGTKICDELNEAGYEDLPKQWWFSNKLGKDLYKSSLIAIPSKVAEEIFYYHDDYTKADFFLSVHLVYTVIDNQDRCIGLTAKLNPKNVDLLTSILDLR